MTDKVLAEGSNAATAAAAAARPKGALKPLPEDALILIPMRNTVLFPGVISPVDAKEARAVGRMAVKLATGTQHAHGSVAIVRAKAGPYKVTFEHTDLRNVAKETRPMEAGLLKGDNDVDASFLDYVRPLVGELPMPARLSDLPLG